MREEPALSDRPGGGSRMGGDFDFHLNDDDARAVGLKLNGPSCPIQDTAHLHSADRALNCRPMNDGPSPDRAANEYVAATNR